MANEIDQITTHAVDALGRLLEQYKGKPRIGGIVSALGTQFQDMENVVFSLVAGRALATAIGAQLDLIGSIIGLARSPGQTDSRYRTLLYVKIGQNTSQGTPEKLISVYKLLSGADIVFYQNLTRASVLLATDVDIDPTNDPDEVIFLYRAVEAVVAGGVRIDYLICFAPNGESFAFAGSNPNAPGLGFGNTLNPTEGGKLARIHRLLIPFAFAGLSTNRRGFGSIRDPLTGGTLVTT